MTASFAIEWGARHACGNTCHRLVAGTATEPSAAIHVGARRRLNERGMLTRVGSMSYVSGGSIVGPAGGRHSTRSPATP